MKIISTKLVFLQRIKLLSKIWEQSLPVGIEPEGLFLSLL